MRSGLAPLFMLALSACAVDVESEPIHVEQPAITTRPIVAPCLCRLTVTDVVTSDYNASVGELVQVDMTGKIYPDLVRINLPEADAANRGLPIEVATINIGGAEDGSTVMLTTTAGQTIHPTAEQTLSIRDHEVMVRLISNGEAWVVTALR